MSHFEVTLLSHKQPLECSQKMMQNYAHNAITNIYKHQCLALYCFCNFINFYQTFEGIL